MSPQRTTQSTTLSVEHVIIRPSPALLIVQLVSVGLVIMLFLFLLGFFFELLNRTFGSSFSWVADHRLLLLFVGLTVYVVIGYILYKQWSSIVYTIYPDHIVLERGWLIRTKRTLEMRQFGGVTVEQSLLGKLLQYGSIRLLFAGAVGKLAAVSIADVSDPFENYQLMLQLVNTRGSAGQ